MSVKAKDYKSGIKPIWCPGCGHYSVLNAITKAMAARELAAHNTAIISGIGSSSRLPAYVSSYGFHGVHGRGLPLATGLKVARPDLEVVAVGGDGDGFSIGGNHFLHACRRNVDIVYIAMDNEVYGMTKGQASPTSREDFETSTSPDGPKQPPVNPHALALASGAASSAASSAAGLAMAASAAAASVVATSAAAQAASAGASAV
jgi:2-oxoglutarate ferredoxin oxidoreductase subunit beta